MSDRPDLSKRRTITPAPDEDVDPIDGRKQPANISAQLPGKLTPRTQAKIPSAVSAKSSQGAVPTRDLNLQVTAEVMETIDFAKFRTKLTKREIVQRAVLAYWSEYRPMPTNES